MEPSAKDISYYLLVFRTLHFFYVLVFLSHIAFAFPIFFQEGIICPRVSASTNVVSVCWNCSVVPHTKYFIASTFRLLARDPLPRVRRSSSTRLRFRLSSGICHHWAGMGVLSCPGKKNKKEDRRIHCHRPKRFVLSSMWIGVTPPYLYWQSLL